MRFATYQHDGRITLGVVDAAGETVAPLGPANSRGVAALIGHDGLSPGPALPLAAVRLLAPIPRPARNIFCVGKNYRAHVLEFARSGFDRGTRPEAMPEAPVVFTKVPECVVGPGEPIPVDAAVSRAVDYEAELAVIIGVGGRTIGRQNAMRHVWGYTIINDVTARDLQGRHQQWFVGKSQDGFGPMGPWVVTAGALDLADIPVRCWVNGEQRQDANTRDLIFDVPALIESISAGITLYPGDIIATGTSVGVGVGFDPPRYLRPGDVVRIEIGGIGVLENPVVARGR